MIILSLVDSLIRTASFSQIRTNVSFGSGEIRPQAAKPLENPFSLCHDHR